MTNAERQSKMRRERAAAGLCAYCGKRPPREGKQSCQTCCDYWAARRSTPEGLRREATRRRRAKAAVLAAYGNACTCCGEECPTFLTIDHVERDGAAWRRQRGLGAGLGTYEWLAKHGFPDGFQVLCFNCNCGREQNNGICPHEEERGYVRQLRAVS